MRKIFTLCLILIRRQTAWRRPYNNEWIDYSKTYYKFKVTGNGLYRIPAICSWQAQDCPADAKDFQLFRNGVEVPVYTSVNSGPLSSADYIEFWGQMNDGKPTNHFTEIRLISIQINGALQSDTAVYFLTLNPCGSPLSIIIPSRMIRLRIFFRWNPISCIQPALISKTRSIRAQRPFLKQYIYSSSYDMGEFWSSNFSTPGRIRLSDNQNNLFIYQWRPRGKFKIRCCGMFGYPAEYPGKSE